MDNIIHVVLTYGQWPYFMGNIDVGDGFENRISMLVDISCTWEKTPQVKTLKFGPQWLHGLLS